MTEAEWLACTDPRPMLETPWVRDITRKRRLFTVACCHRVDQLLTGAGRVSSTVAALAQTIYADRAFDRLPILADALEEAGCDNADILTHCRGDGPHVRGCWVVDLILGKE